MKHLLLLSLSFLLAFTGIGDGTGDLTPDAAKASHPAPFAHSHNPQAKPPRARTMRKSPVKRAQRRRHQGLYVGLNAGGSLLFRDSQGQIEDARPGGGMLEVVSGAQFNPYFAVELTALAMFHQDQRSDAEATLILGFCANAKLFINPAWDRIRPYLLVGLGTYGSNQDDGRDPLVGLGVQGGVGLDLALNPFVALVGNITFRGALWENPSSSYFQSLMNFTGGLRLSI